MEWSHKRHAANKCDSKNGGIASCRDCHREFHAGGKAVKRKPGRVMSKAEALKYLRETTCFCAGPKKPDLPFCNDCKSKLSPQSLLDLAELTNRAWLQAMADAERELMAA